MTDETDDTPSLSLDSSAEEVFNYGIAGSVSDPSRSNFQEALAVLQFQVLLEQQRTAKYQRWTAVATFLLFAATIALVVVTPG